ncbi:opacity family porin [Bisgaardia hudsonensis]|uniref:Opacity family porin n=1 Tax=Bisgaardia hudsonensis TaxID=109472 RepID=A0A4R2MU83_9PAST|nr:opacity family porin [Bisgaardia hudsonensis]QLB12182.1 hypothetical protein A6A11_00410 [Bisgaardia hudsonensis]TCP12220.1 opacity family porin [Bisgaardia hudsonensis]
MKKLLIATILSTTIISASATELPVIDSYGIYFQGDIGVSNIKFTDEDFPKLPKQKISTQRISLGYYYNNSRFSLDYTNIEQIKWKYLLGNLDLKVKSFGFSIFRDFEFSSNLVPYLGFRLSLNKANMLHSYFNIPFVETETSSVGY